MSLYAHAGRAAICLEAVFLINLKGQRYNGGRRPILDEAAGASYELSEAQYADNEAGDTWVQRLLASLVAILQWLQPLLTPNNYDTLVASVLERVRHVQAGYGCALMPLLPCHDHFVQGRCE